VVPVEAAARGAGRGPASLAACAAVLVSNQTPPAKPATTSPRAAKRYQRTRVGRVVRSTSWSVMLVSSSVVGHPYRNKERIIPLPNTPYIYETARAARRGAAWRGVTAPARGSLARGSLARGSLARRRGGRPGTTRLQRQPGTRPQHARRQLPAHDLLGQ